MKLAIVCDDLVQKGGQEKLVFELLKIWPNAILYTSVASEYWINYCKERNISLKTSFLQRLPFIEKLNKLYSVFLLHILAFEKMDFTSYDIVLSVSSRYAHFIKTKPTTKHICYMNSPGRMFWEPFDYFKTEQIPWLFRFYLKLFLSYIRDIDYVAAQKVDSFIANAKTPALRIKKYYRRDAVIIYPPVETSQFDHTLSNAGDYFLIITRLSSWKRVDIAIEACNRLGLNLKIVGEGTDKVRLQKMSGGTIELLGYVSDAERNNLLYNCKAFIMTQKEDFGIAAVEALSCGKPVIAYAAGGALETIMPGQTGEFFMHQTTDSLIDVLKQFNPAKYDPRVCSLQAEKYDSVVFKTKLKKAIMLY